MSIGLAERFPFLERLSVANRRELNRLVSTRVRPGHRLLQRGDPVDGAYLIVGGSLRVFYITASGREATLYRVEPGGTCILALTASFNRQPYPAWVEAGTVGGEFVRVPSELFRRLLDGEAAFREFIFGVLSARVFELMRALEETGTAQLEQRVARFLMRAVGADGSVRISQAGIAAELGTAREVVFRALRSLAQRELIRTGRMRIRILEPKKLRALAECGDDFADELLRE
jgi:CRP/FNR family transcriptional regulator